MTRRMELGALVVVVAVTPTVNGEIKTLEELLEPDATMLSYDGRIEFSSFALQHAYNLPPTDQIYVTTSASVPSGFTLTASAFYVERGPRETIDNQIAFTARAVYGSFVGAEVEMTDQIFYSSGTRGDLSVRYSDVDTGDEQWIALYSIGGGTDHLADSVSLADYGSLVDVLWNMQLRASIAGGACLMAVDFRFNPTPDPARLVEAYSVLHHADGSDVVELPIDLEDGLIEPREQRARQAWIRMVFDYIVSPHLFPDPISPDPGVPVWWIDSSVATEVILTFNGVLPTGRYDITMGSESFPICYVQGDVNCSGDTTALDLAVIQSPTNWNLELSQGASPRADVNRDGHVTGLDLAKVQDPAFWNQPSPPLTCTCP